MQATEQFAMLPLEVLRESTLNPRKHFDQRKLEELADSIDQHGVITPLIVRESGRMPMKGKPDSVAYEIAAGHRRYRAAKSLGRELELPCRVMELSDTDFLEILTIENLQRDDIHPLEEADGYKALLANGRYEEPDFAGEAIRNLADKIGKSEAYVRGRLELCDLVDPARQSFLQDSITIGHARLISRAPADRQEELLAACFSTWGKRELLSLADFRSAAMRLLKGQPLAKAPFDLEDGSLKSDAGPCTTCPRRSDQQQSLIDVLDDDGALCLDGSCFSQKLNAHIQRATASGVVAITEQYSGDIPPGVASAREYVVAAGKDTDRIEELKGELQYLFDNTDKGDEKEIAKLEAELAEVEADDGECEFAEDAIVVHGYHSIGKQMRICRKPECPKHGKEVANRNEIYGKGGGRDTAKEKAAEEKKKRERKLDQAIRRRAWETLLGAVDQHGEVNGRVLYLAASGFFHAANGDFCKAFGIPVEKGEYRPAKKWAANATDAELIRFIVAAALDGVGLGEFFIREHHKDEWQLFRDTLADYDVSYKDIEGDVRAEWKEAETAKKAKASKKAKPAPVATGKPKAKSSKMAAAGDDEDDE